MTISLLPILQVHQVAGPEGAPAPTMDAEQASFASMLELETAQIPVLLEKNKDHQIPAAEDVLTEHSTTQPEQDETFPENSNAKAEVEVEVEAKTKADVETKMELGDEVEIETSFVGETSLDDKVAIKTEAVVLHAQTIPARRPKSLAETSFAPIVSIPEANQPAQVTENRTRVSVPLAEKASPTVRPLEQATALPLNTRSIPVRETVVVNPMHVAASTHILKQEVPQKDGRELIYPTTSTSDRRNFAELPVTPETRDMTKTVTSTADKSTTHTSQPSLLPERLSPNVERPSQQNIMERIVPAAQPAMQNIQSYVTTPNPAAPMPMPLLNTSSKFELFEKSTDLPLVQGFTEVQSTSQRTAFVTPPNLPVPTPQVAQSVAHQMAVAVSQTAGGNTELVLSPEELGRVRMVMSIQETSIAVLIHTERPEINDLLRRHIDTLSQEFKNMGYDTTSFAFAQDQQGDSPNENAQDDSPTVLSENISDSSQPVRLATSAGLDLRL